MLQHTNRIAAHMFLNTSLLFIFNSIKKEVISVSYSFLYSFASAYNLIFINIYICLYTIGLNNSLSYSIIVELIKVYNISLPLK
jgi:hypothetical protein